MISDRGDAAQMGNPAFDFSGKVAIVTGAGSGMGLSAARMLAAAGATVVLADINAAQVKTAAAELSNARAVAVDVRDADQVQAMVDNVAAEQGDIDLLFNNAGILGPAGAIAEATPGDYDRIFDVNVRGSFLCLSAVLRAMIRRGKGGAIVNTASIAGLRGVAQVGLYAASKFAVIGLTRSAAKEAGAHGIRVNAICPGPTETGFSQMSDAILTASKAAVPLGRIATADDMALAALWLLSDGAAFLNGVILPVDGGQTA